MANNETSVEHNLFGFGDKNVAFAKYFTGTSYLNGLVQPDDNVDVNVSNVNFEPGCRNNWHIHHNGFQILLVTAGEGWYQVEGKPAQLLHPGDVVAIHEGVKRTVLPRILGFLTLQSLRALANGVKKLVTKNTHS